MAAVIREAIEQDLPRLMELLWQLSQLGQIPEARPREPTERERAALRALGADPRSTCLVLEIGGQVEGTLTVYLLPNLSHGARPYAVIENVVIEERLRGTGHGRQLMAHAEALAAAAGCYKIVLTSNRRRAAAHRFYEQLGYTITHHGFTRYLVA